MTCDEALDFLYSSLPAFHRQGAGAYKPGLGTSIALDEMLGKPSRKYPCIHIAGTNGKGSTAHTLAAILQAQGYRTGLYTSPHIFDFGERIRVDGEKIPNEAIVEFVEWWKKSSTGRLGLTPSFFELTSSMAFDWFAKCNVDYAVIETGLGGRLDSTNIITPVLSIITNISLDHTQFLGTTLEEIAAEKAGIIKEGVPVVIGEALPETMTVFERIARERHAPLYRAAPIDMEERDDRNHYPATPFGPLDGQLTGIYQKFNTATVLTAVMALRNEGIAVSDRAVAEGMARVVDMTHLAGRWTKVADRPKTVIDTGHNEGGWRRIAEQLTRKRVKDVRLVCGFVADKDLSHIFPYIKSIPNLQGIYFCTPSTPRGLRADLLAQAATEAGIEGIPVGDVNEAVRMARKACLPDGLVLVAGSNFLIADLRIGELSSHD